MKALFLGNVAVDTYEGIKDELPASLDCVIINDPVDRSLLPDAAADADILVSNRWMADYPPAPKLRLVQSVATGVELFDLASLPKGCAVCNAFGHETAIAEYVVMAMLALHHRFFQIAGEFRERGSWATSWVQSGVPRGAVRLPYPRRQPYGARARSGGRTGLSADRTRRDAAALRHTGDLHGARP